MNHNRFLVCALLFSPFVGLSQTDVKPFTGTKNKNAKQHYSAGLKIWPADHNAGIAEFKAAIAEDTGYIEAYDILGNVYSQMKHSGSAEYYYLEAIKRYPANVFSIRGLGRVYISTQEYEQAIFYFKQAIVLEPENADGYTGLATAYAGLKKFPEAIENAFKAEKYYKDKNSPYLADWYVTMSVIYIGADNKDEARKYRDIAKSMGKELPAKLAEKLEK